MADATRSLRGGCRAPHSAPTRALSFWRREPGRAQWLAGDRLASLVAMFAAWWAATRPDGLVSPLFLPPPLEVWGGFVRLGSRPYLGSTLGQHMGASL